MLISRGTVFSRYAWSRFIYIRIVIVKEKSLRKAVEMCFSGKCIMTIIEPTFQRVKARTSQARAEKNCGITTAHDNNNRG